MSEPYDDVARDVVARLTALGRTVAVAESLTGGLVTSALVSVPGASAVVRGGVVAYMTDVKTSALGVDPDLLARVGAVDPDVAAAMASGVAERLEADYGVATTGVAGPDPQDGHPVGEVWIALHESGAGTVADALRVDPAAGRTGIRVAATAAVLTLLRDALPPGSA